MGYVKEMADRNQLVEASFYNKSSTALNGVITEAYSDVADLIVTALFWTGPAVDRVVSQKLRPIVDGVLTLDYEDYTVVIKENAKVVINDVSYSVVYIENVGNQNVIIQIPVKRF